MRNSMRQLKLLAKINLMGEFEILLGQSIANCKSLESSKWKTGIFMYCIGCTSSSVGNASSTVCTIAICQDRRDSQQCGHRYGHPQQLLYRQSTAFLQCKFYQEQNSIHNRPEQKAQRGGSNLSHPWFLGSCESFV